VNIANDIQGTVWWEARDNNVQLTAAGRAYATPNSTTLTIDKDMANGVWLNSGTKRIGFNINYEFEPS
jgi:hypothetical protein